MPASIKLDSELKERLKNLAEIKKRTMHWLMLDALRDYVEREEKKEAFKQDALTAWHNHQQTGLHVTMQEADAWLTQLAAGQYTEPPQCHN
jgi:predicted transcriptional regulator